LAVSVGFYQTGIDSKTFTADQTFGHATAHYSLEHVPQYIAVTEAAMTVLGEGRMVRHIAIETQPAEPSVGQVQMDLLAQPPLRPDAKTIADYQHPDQQFRIDRRPASGTVERRQVRPHPIKINEPVDRPKHVVGWYVLLQRKYVEKRRLIGLPLTHHGFISAFDDRVNQRF
jgi:hypothetical protein